MQKKIILTVTNDLTHDRRMQRICTSLTKWNHDVLLVGRALPNSQTLDNQSFKQKRLFCFFKKGFPFYAEFNFRLFLFLLFSRFDTVCSIDLDTLPAGCFASILRRKKRVFDAHEYFTEVPEVESRPFVKAIWEIVARVCLPFYKNAYTVGPALADIFTKKYKIPFKVIRNVPPQKESADEDLTTFQKLSNQMPAGKANKIILYQGALNEGRGLEAAIEAMQNLKGFELHLAGEGDLSDELRKLVIEKNLQNKVKFLGWVHPKDLTDLTETAWAGLNLLENRGLSYFYSLANKFFDYCHAQKPCITMNFPEYAALNAEHETAILLDDLEPKKIAAAVNKLNEKPQFYEYLQKNCLFAAKNRCWELEELVLKSIY